MAVMSKMLGSALALAASVAASPVSPRSQIITKVSRDDPVRIIIDTDVQLEPMINASFADPGILRAGDGLWYAFATNNPNTGFNVPRASAPEPLGPWERIDGDAMPDLGWTNGEDYWAPDVRELPDGSYIMYFSGTFPGERHCVGVSRSATPEGPYEPDAEPWNCDHDLGGSIDPAGFFDEATGKMYVTYKIDGNALGNGGSCNNGIPPINNTPLMLQEVDAEDGSTKIGDAIEIMGLVEADGPVIEAPNIVEIDGTYVLFFSSGCYDGDGYSTKYAWADSVTGPYTRATETLLQSPDLGLRGPGGATSTEEGLKFLALHGYCGDSGRCFYVVPFEFEQD